MSGLRNICRAYGGMTIKGVRYVWDYVAEEPVKDSEMPAGSERWKASEAARSLNLKPPARPIRDDGGNCG